MPSAAISAKRASRGIRAPLADDTPAESPICLFRRREQALGGIQAEVLTAPDVSREFGDKKNLCPAVAFVHFTVPLTTVCGQVKTSLLPATTVIVNCAGSAVARLSPTIASPMV